VETVGDKYMAVSGLPELCVDNSRHICQLALDMMELSKKIEVDGISVQVQAQHARVVLDVKSY